jgi:hypothetical protein
MCRVIHPLMELEPVEIRLLNPRRLISTNELL